MYPVEEILPQLRQALASHHTLILQAPPGAGKTTLVPLALLNEPWLAGKSIVMLEPRRLAARAAASRMASLRNEKIGEGVGYRIRFESKVSARTRIEVLTEGILTRRLQRDPMLEGVGLVIFDEFHERHLHGDLALALCRDAQANLREDLRILIMSATLDGELLSRRLQQAPIISSAGRSYPVDIVMSDVESQQPLPQQVAQAVLRAIKQHEGDALVFLPGAWEIRRTQDILSAQLPGTQFEVLPLYGDLPWEAQDRALRRIDGKRKIVLATPIAETSLTIDGVTIVIDSGLARVPQFDPNTGLTKLITQRISRANADQRAGRAGRTAPGCCYRLWNNNTQRGLLAQPIPEIMQADLAPLLLELTAWGVQDPMQLQWIDPPPGGAIAQAQELLQQIDALDNDGRITAIGKLMAELPLHPRLAHMLLHAQQLGMASLACDIAAILGERDMFAGARESIDLILRLQALADFRRHGRNAAQRLHADPNVLSRIEQVAAQYHRLLRIEQDATVSNMDEAGILLAAAYPDRVAQQRETQSDRYVLANGRGARLPKQENRLRSPYLVAATLDAGDNEGVLQLAAAITLEQIHQVCAGHITTTEAVRWDANTQSVQAQREQRLFALVLSQQNLNKIAPELMQHAMLDGIRQMGIDALPWTPTLRQWQARVLSLRQWCPQEALPDISDTALLASMHEWLLPFLTGVTRREHLVRVDLTAALHAILSWQQSQRVNEGAPERLQVPSGSNILLEYIPGQSPALAVKLQELFGCADTPRIAWGKIPVTLHLLSPARRPIQVTQDLKNFWQNTYIEVKKELKGRYPKHPWPDDPWNATPTARAKPRGKS